MSKKTIAVSLITASLLLPLIALAQPGGGITLDSLIDSIKSAAWKVFGIVAVICFVVAGILFLTSQGNAEKIASARNAFLWGVAGVIVGVLAFSIITFVQAIIH